MYRVILAFLVLLMGGALIIGGGWLGWLGGSWFFLILGLVVLASGLLLLGHRPAGLSAFAVAILFTLVWSIWEVGADWWALAPRGGLLFAIGILLLLPPLVRDLDHVGSTRRGYGVHAAALAASLMISALVGLYALFQNPHELEGRFTAERMNAGAGAQVAEDIPAGEWQAYGRTSAGQRYSPMAQITPDNVEQLEEVWRYRTGEIRDAEEDPVETTYEVTPLIVNNRMYLCTPFGTVIALDPVSGEELWVFDPHLRKPPRETTQHMTCRGVSYYDGTGEGAGGAQQSAANGDSAERVQLSAKSVTQDAAGVPQNVVTGNAERGEPNPNVVRQAGSASTATSAQCRRRLYYSTPDGRLISLSAETGEICPGFGGEDGTVNLWANMPNITPGSVYSTSPPVITDRVVIVGGAINDNVAVTSPSGVIRAYDLQTGELVWNFDSGNPSSTEPAADSQTYSNNSPNSWSIASYDPDLRMVYLPMGVPSPDQYGVYRSESDERFANTILALDADTGEVAWEYQVVHHDLWDYDPPAQPSLVDLTLNGQRVPALVTPTKQGDIFVLNRETGEPIHPVRELPAPGGAIEPDWTAPTQPASSISFRPDPLEEKDMWGATLIDQMMCRISFRQLNYEGAFTPPSLDGTLVYPGNFGVFNWGSLAVDPHRQIIFGMPVYLAFTSQFEPREDDFTRVVTKDGEPVINENFGAPYAVKLGAFRSPLGLPCQQPPWGYVAAVDLVTGETIYRHVNGTVRDLSPIPLPFEMGVPGIGGPIVTRGGVAFLSGTLDYYVRAYDLASGEQLWKSRLPAGGQATPATYEGADGRQYLVVVAGGHGSTGTAAGDYVIAYALPR